MQELRDIAMTEAVKGKFFFVELDIKGPSLKLDNTGKSILTVSDLITASCHITEFLLDGLCPTYKSFPYPHGGLFVVYIVLFIVNRDLHLAKTHHILIVYDLSVWVSYHNQTLFEKYLHYVSVISQVLRHLGRINETRIGHHRVIILSKPQ